MNNICYCFIRLQLNCDYNDRYFNYQNRDLPIRWAPHEAVIEDEWSAKSDVYSFAVIVWEICFQAELPFSQMNDLSVIRLLEKNQLKLEAPEAIPNILRDLLIKCWSTSPKDRPTFTDIYHTLNKALHNINK
jgi:PTK7 protein tyrosine kinase 7